MPRRARTRPAGPDALVVADATVRFGGVVALDGVSLHVRSEGVTGLIGPNGAGKTTLFGVAGGFVTPDAGRVFFHDRDVTGWPAHRRAAAGIGRTFQRLELFGRLSALENLLVAREVRRSKATLFDDLFALRRAATHEHAARDAAEQILSLVGLEWARDREAASLPLGAGRLLEIGRALCAEPSLLMLDEPTSGLDARESEMVASLIGRVRTQLSVSVLLVEHDVDFVASVCDDVFVLDFGRMIAHGPPDRIGKHPVVRAAYLGAEAAS
ncbi:MAG TPA: ABC transporter ATP-binding protein [Actinomycetota bacterium]|nr:ABC transporter ATP-binding protein [Actinomycetota bacterium]